MSDPALPPDDRRDELLAERALFGLSPEDQAELDRLLAAAPGVAPDSLDRLAADLALSSLGPPEPLPASLRAKVLQQAPRPTRVDAAPLLPFARAGGLPGPVHTHRKFRAVFGWCLAVAGLLMSLGVWWGVHRETQTETPAQQRQELLAQRGKPDSGVIHLDWTATKDPAAAGAGGDVVWSGRDQKGYMLFRGLPANDPKQIQYQLWIFDGERDERYPVDGGVFDVPAGGGDVVVPIRPKLRVGRPVLFAVTIEPPGGVVVSSRERLPLLAKVPG